MKCCASAKKFPTMAYCFRGSFMKLRSELVREMEYSWLRVE